MTDRNDRIRIIVQKLTEAIWNLDQLQPLDKGLEEEYVRIQLAREHLMKQVKKDGFAKSFSAAAEPYA